MQTLLYVSLDGGDLAWVGRGGSDGTLVEFTDANDDAAAFPDELAAFVRRTDADGDA